VVIAVGTVIFLAREWMRRAGGGMSAGSSG